MAPFSVKAFWWQPFLNYCKSARNSCSNFEIGYFSFNLPFCFRQYFVLLLMFSFYLHLQLDPSTPLPTSKPPPATLLLLLLLPLCLSWLLFLLLLLCCVQIAAIIIRLNQKQTNRMRMPNSTEIAINCWIFMTTCEKRMRLFCEMTYFECNYMTLQMNNHIFWMCCVGFVKTKFICLCETCL